LITSGEYSGDYMASKQAYAGAVLLLSIALIGSISVVGLLQSTERIGTSGTVTQPPSPPPPTPPPPEPTVEIDIYEDSELTQLISTVEWGSVEAGSSVSETVYILNAGDENVTLSLTTENWEPTDAAEYMELSWDYDGYTLEPGNVLEVTLTLTVDSSITGIEEFSFDIVITGSAL
jgi:hypothetical protein